MPRPNRFAPILAVALAIATPAHANWTSDPTMGLAVCSANRDQYMTAILADDYGGAWIAWADTRDNFPDEIYIQHILAAGTVDPTWPTNGLLVCDAHNAQQLPVLAPDGSGGVYVAWVDTRVSGTNPDVYMHHVLGNGTVDPSWPYNGAVVSWELGQDTPPSIMADGSGGAFVCFSSTSVNLVVRVHRILPTGAQDPAWTDAGVRLSLTNYNQARPQMVSDGSGGLIVAWDDERNGAGDIYAMHVFASGALDPAWPVNGRALCTAPGTQISARLASDGAGGAIVAWQDRRVSTDGDIYAQRILANGMVDPAWPADGRAVCDTAGGQAGHFVVSDGEHGCIVTWADKRYGNSDLFAQRVLADGTIPAAARLNGSVLCLAPGDQDFGATTKPLLTDGLGGAYLVWHDAQTGSLNKDIYATHVLQDGTRDPAWPARGLAVCTATGNQVGPSLTSDGAGGFLACWWDNRGGTDYDIYAQRVAQNGTLPNVGVGPAALPAGARFDAPRPNPTGASSVFRYAIDADGPVGFDVLDVSGRIMCTFETASVPAGEREFRWDLLDQAGRPVANGLYFARLRTNGRVLMRRIAVLR